MTEQEKVIKALEYCINETHCGVYCPYWNDDNNCRVHMEIDALTLLKAQEPVEPKKVNRYINFDGEGEAYIPETYDCGACGNELPWKANYCPECGQAVKWDG